MADAAAFDDHAIVQRVIDLFAETRHHPVASRLASIEFGSIDLWRAFQYDFADLLYDHVWSREHPELQHPRGPATPGDQGFLEYVIEQLWRGPRRRALWPEWLERTGALDLLEGAQFLWRSHSGTRASPAPIAIAGFAYRSSVLEFAPFVNHQEASFQVLLHDDNLGRHRRAYRPFKAHLIAGESFLRSSDYRRAAQRARDVEAIVAPKETCGLPLAEVFDRFAAKFHRRRFRRLYLGARALEEYLGAGVARTLVIPDERQPLARAAAAAAKTSSSAKVVSIPEPVDQFVRKMPYCGDIGSDVVVVACPAARRVLTRSGISAQKFRACPFPGLESLLDSVAASPNLPGRVEARRRSVLYCDQGLPGASHRFAELVECLGDPPRATVIFRPHPIQSTPLLRLVVRGGRIVRSQPLIEAIRASDVVVTHSSMVALVAALLERPVILWNPAASPTMPALLLERVAYWARTPGELAGLMISLLDSAPDHPLRTHQVTFRGELATSGPDADLAEVL
jgi:hypothetical protein